MEKAREIVSSILKERQIDTIYFVGCGGSLAGFFPAKYFISCEARKVKVGYINSNEFVYATPKEIGENAVVILASQRGNTAETVEACKVANEKGAATIGLTFEVPSPLSEAARYVIHYEMCIRDRDSVVVIESISGDTKEVVEAVDKAHEVGARVIGYVEKEGTPLYEKSDYLVTTVGGGYYFWYTVTLRFLKNAGQFDKYDQFFKEIVHIDVYKRQQHPCRSSGPQWSL